MEVQARDEGWERDMHACCMDISINIPDGYVNRIVYVYDVGTAYVPRTVPHTVYVHGYI